jgi:hypothetical protein
VLISSTSTVTHREWANEIREALDGDTVAWYEMLLDLYHAFALAATQQEEHAEFIERSIVRKKEPTFSKEPYYATGQPVPYKDPYWES